MATHVEKRKKHRKTHKEVRRDKDDGGPVVTIDTSKFVENSDDYQIVSLPYGRARNGDYSGVKFWLSKSSQQDMSKKNDRTMYAKMDGMCYIGHAEKQRNTVGVVSDDDSDNRLFLYFARKYNFRPYCNDEAVMDEAVDEVEESMTKYEKTDRLVGAFGSAKSKRNAESRNKNKLEGEAHKAALGLAASDVLLTLAAEPDTSFFTNECNMMPVCHKDAERIEDVYLISDLITEAEMTALSNVSSEFIESTRDQVLAWRQENKFSLHVLDRLEFLTHDEKIRNHKSRCLRYLQYLITMFQMKASDLKKSNPLPSTMPEIIKHNLLEKFTVLNTVTDSTKPTRSMPKRVKHALLAHILVLSLIIDDQHSNCTSLMRDLRLPDMRALPAHVGAIGARLKIDKKGAVTSDDFIYTVALQFPLQFRVEMSLKRKRE